MDYGVVNVPTESWAGTTYKTHVCTIYSKHGKAHFYHCNHLCLFFSFLETKAFNLDTTFKVNTISVSVIAHHFCSFYLMMIIHINPSLKKKKC